MIKVYFQSIVGSHSELVAVFTSEKSYESAYPWLRVLAEEQRCIVTESAEDMSQEISHLGDAIDELSLNLNVVDEPEQQNAYKSQIEDLEKIEELLKQLN